MERHPSESSQRMRGVAHGSIFDLDPAAAHWLAETFEVGSPEHALLDSLALAAEANAVRRGLRANDADGEPRPLADLLSRERISLSVGAVAAAFPDLPVPRTPGPSQVQAIDAFVRQPRSATSRDGMTSRRPRVVAGAEVAGSVEISGTCEENAQQIIRAIRARFEMAMDLTEVEFRILVAQGNHTRVAFRVGVPGRESAEARTWVETLCRDALRPFDLANPPFAAIVDLEIDAPSA